MYADETHLTFASNDVAHLEENMNDDLIKITEWLTANKLTLSKWFEPRSISSSYSVIVRVSVVLRRTVNSSSQNYMYTHLDDHTIRNLLLISQRLSFC